MHVDVSGVPQLVNLVLQTLVHFPGLVAKARRAFQSPMVTNGTRLMDPLREVKIVNIGPLSDHAKQPTNRGRDGDKQSEHKIKKIGI